MTATTSTKHPGWTLAIVSIALFMSRAAAGSAPPATAPAPAPAAAVPVASPAAAAEAVS